MSEANHFQNEFILADRMSEFTPEVFVQFCTQLMDAVEALDLPFYGGVNAQNISMDDDGNVAIGDALGADNVRYTAEQIEYLAPEVFWNNEKSVQADVYSIGLMMYTWANAGCLPFLYPGAQSGDRAEALRRRMSGEAFEKSPVSKTLNTIIDKATAYTPADRYATIAELKEAFGKFAQEAETEATAMADRMELLKARQAREAKMMANILAAAEAAAAAAATEKANAPKRAANIQMDPIEPEEGPKKMSVRPLVAVLLIAAILMVAAVAMQFGSAGSPGSQANNPGSSENPPASTPGDLPEGNENNVNNQGGNNQPINGFPANVTPTVPVADPNASPDITPLPTPSIAPTVAPVVKVTPSPVPNIDMSRYTLYRADTSWSAAADNCTRNGGHLVSIGSKDEFSAITMMADRLDVEMIWVGGFRKAGNIVWLDGTTSDYIPWAPGEPTYRDQAGHEENFLMLVKMNGVWCYNDIMDDPVSLYPDAYKGKIAYILEK